MVALFLFGLMMVFFSAVLITYSNAVKEREEEEIRREYLEYLHSRRCTRRRRRC